MAERVAKAEARAVNSGTTPICLQEHLQLQSLGISAEHIRFTTVTMESDKFICVRETVGGSSRLVVIDLAHASNPSRLPVTADSAIMNPASQVIALRAGKTIQVFNIEMKTKMKSFQMADDVVFWKWINKNSIALITQTSVYHWSNEGECEPQKMFDRDSSLTESHQIINYHTDMSLKWLLLIGISAQQQHIVGNMQLYSVERKMSQAIEGHAATIAQFKIPDAEEESKLLVYAVRNKTSEPGKLYIIELDSSQRGNQSFRRVEDVHFPSEGNPDFPIAVQVSSRYGVVYLITKYGYFHLFDIESGTCIYTNQISEESVFLTTAHETTGGIIGVNRGGQVFSVTVDEKTVVPYIICILKKPEFALRFATRNNLPGAGDLFMNKFTGSPEATAENSSENVGDSSSLKTEAHYLVHCCDPDLWGRALGDDNPYRSKLIDQVIQTAISETDVAEAVSVTVKAFMLADLPKEMLRLLEKIIFNENSIFKDNRNLQNLLILTAVKVDQSCVIDYINRLDNYDAPDIANICIGSDLHEEAFAIFKKSSMNPSAIEVLIHQVHDLDRASEFAESCDDPAIWSLLAEAQLETHLVKEAIDSFVKAHDISMCNEVVQAANQTGTFDSLVRYLHIARKSKGPSSFVDTELVFALAKTNCLDELKEFISKVHKAELQQVGERCHTEGLHKTAELVFDNIFKQTGAHKAKSTKNEEEDIDLGLLQDQVSTLTLQLQEKDDTIHQLTQKLESMQLQSASPQVTPEPSQHHRMTEFWEVPRGKVTLNMKKVLGSSSWGSVVEGTFHGQTVAIKCLHNLIREPDFVTAIHREIGIMAQVRHPNIVLLMAAVIDGDSDTLIVTEMLDTSLRKAYEGKLLQRSSKLGIFRDIACALNYLHLYRYGPIIHGDISSDNVLLEAKPEHQWKAKLTDFCSARIAKKANVIIRRSSVYTAPELCKEVGIVHTPKLDVYSYGILLCEVTVNAFPTESKLPIMVQSAGERWPFIQTLITSTTVEHPENRPTMANIIGELDNTITSTT